MPALSSKTRLLGKNFKIWTRLVPEPRYSLRSKCNGQHAKTLSEFENQHRDYNWNELSATDFECILCSQCLLDPVTTTCGHTFCRECLTRVLDHGLACPLCMHPLKSSEQFRGENLILSQALRSLASDEWQERLSINRQVLDKLEKNNQIPIFICTSAFPKVACPLFVYEPRYRLLARRCLQSSTKRFGMAAKTNDGDKFAWFGTMLEIRDCVYLSNGTSILTTIGLRRFRVVSRGEQDGYDTAVVQYISDRIVSSEQLPELRHLHERVHCKTIRWLTTLKSRLLDEIERYIGHMPALEENWTTLPDGPSWTWWLVAILPLSLQLRVGFLGGTSLEKRLLAIEKMLDHLKIRMKAVERQSFNCDSNEMSTESCSHTERSVAIHHQDD
uniref:RING-type domain-containing protein n=1 Tax=Photinus pyralis TaxID=7054 RepID=A0A1Y1M3X8_PHOPY